MNAPYTPGPWFDAPGTTTGRIVIAPGQPKVRYSVAACGGQNRDGNARLIAAAPDLLAPAQDAIAILEVAIDLWNSVYPGEPDEVLTDLQLRFRAAIAKATGQ